MEPDETKEQEPQDVGEGTPVCIRCFQPVDPLAHYCPHCGQATGQLTPYIPFVSIPWETSIWGQIWRQIWSRDVSWPGRVFRLLMVTWNVPVMLLGLLFSSAQKPQPDNDAEPDEGGDLEARNPKL